MRAATADSCRLKAVSDGESPSGAALCDWVCDDAASNARVTASKTCTFWTLYADGTASYTGAWVYLDGFEKKNNPKRRHF